MKTIYKNLNKLSSSRLLERKTIMSDKNFKKIWNPKMMDSIRMLLHGLPMLGVAAHEAMCAGAHTLGIDQHGEQGHQLYKLLTFFEVDLSDQEELVKFYQKMESKEKSGVTTYVH
jgi:hypothetical protein